MEVEIFIIAIVVYMVDMYKGDVHFQDVQDVDILDTPIKINSKKNIFNYIILFINSYKFYFKLDSFMI